MDMCLLHPSQILFKPIFSFPSFYCLLHFGHVCGELDAFSVSKPHTVVRLAFYQLHSFSLKGRVKVGKGFLEQIRKKEKGGALVESITIVEDQTATPASIIVLLNDSDSKTCFGKACCACDASGTSTWELSSARARRNLFARTHPRSRHFLACSFLVPDIQLFRDPTVSGGENYM